MRSTDPRWAALALALAAACTRPMPADPEPLIAEPAPRPTPTSTAPDPGDVDGDGLAAWADLCPDRAEDLDDHDDDDGCPDPDNDDDGRLDADDACPDQAETMNSVDDADGCPEAQAVVLGEPDVVTIAFRPGKTDVEAAARPVLDALAQTLVAHPEVQLVELAGLRTGDERRGGLELARARTVLAYLVARGVVAERLQVRAGDAPASSPRVEVRVRMAVRP